MTPSERAALRALCGKRAKADLKRLFKLIRCHDDRALFAAVAPRRKRAGGLKADPLARELEQCLRPILGPAAEKAELLVEHLAKRHPRKPLSFEPKGIADAVRRLRAHLTELQIRTGAKSLMAALADSRSTRETVV